MFDGTWADWAGKLAEIEPGELAVGLAAIVAMGAALRMFWVQLDGDGTRRARLPIWAWRLPPLAEVRRRLSARPAASLSSLVFNLMAAAALAGTLVVSLTIGARQQGQSDLLAQSARLLEEYTRAVDHVLQLKDEVQRLTTDLDTQIAENSRLTDQVAAATKSDLAVVTAWVTCDSGHIVETVQSLIGLLANTSEAINEEDLKTELLDAVSTAERRNCLAP